MSQTIRRITVIAAAILTAAAVAAGGVAASDSGTAAPRADHILCC
jgi:hypothetical protein